MRRHFAVLMAAAVLELTGIGFAASADLPERRFVRELASYCPKWGVSQIATLPSLDRMVAEVDAKYDDSDRVAESRAAIDSNAPRYVWAVAARTACGIALGHLSTGEVNATRLWNCECYHARMLSYGRSLRY